MEEVFFIDEDGNKIHCDTICSHIGLAKLLLKNNEKLRREYESSGKQDPIDFLIMNKGYLKVSDLGYYYRKLVYSSLLTSDKQKELIEFYQKSGYEVDDLILKKLMENREKDKL